MVQIVKNCQKLSTLSKLSKLSKWSKLSKLSNIVKIFQNFQKFSKIVKNCPNCQKLSSCSAAWKYLYGQMWWKVQIVLLLKESFFEQQKHDMTCWMIKKHLKAATLAHSSVSQNTCLRNMLSFCFSKPLLLWSICDCICGFKLVVNLPVDPTYLHSTCTPSHPPEQKHICGTNRKQMTFFLFKTLNPFTSDLILAIFACIPFKNGSRSSWK